MHLFSKLDCLGQETHTSEACDLSLLKTNLPLVDASDDRFDGITPSLLDSESARTLRFPGMCSALISIPPGICPGHDYPDQNTHLM